MNELEKLQVDIDERFRAEFCFLPKEELERRLKELPYHIKLKNIFNWHDELIEDAYLK